MLSNITRKEIIDFIKIIKENASGNLYLLSLSISLLSNIAFEQKEYKLLYRYFKQILPLLKENREIYISYLEDAVKASFLAKKYKDFSVWVKEYLTLKTPSNFVLELIKSYAILNAIKFNRKKAIDFFNLFAFGVKKNTSYSFQPDFREKVYLMNSFSKAYEYSFDLRKSPVKPLVETICNNIEEERNGTIKNYLLSNKIMSKEIAKDRTKRKEFIDLYILYLISQCLGLRYRFTHDKNILDEIQKLFSKNNSHEHIIREASFVWFKILKYDNPGKEEFEKAYNNYIRAVHQFYKLEKNKQKTNKFHKEAVLLVLYSYLIINKEPDKVKKIHQQYADLFNQKDTRSLYKIIFNEQK